MLFRSGTVEVLPYDVALLGFLRRESNINSVVIDGQHNIDGMDIKPLTTDVFSKLYSERLGNDTFGRHLALAANFNVDFTDRKIKLYSALIQVKNAMFTVNGEFDFPQTGAQGQVIVLNKTTRLLEYFDTTNYNLYGNNANLAFLGYLRRDIQQVFINGSHSVNGSVVQPFTKKKFEELYNLQQTSKPFISDIKEGYYESTMAYTNPYNNDLTTGLYAFYDDLVAAYPDYVTKILLGNQAQGYPIYRYDFKPPTYSDTAPKIVYTTCTHGYEKPAAYSAAMFMKEICDNWESSDILRMLRFNVHFIAIPIVNPSGYILGTRKTENGVDLNRAYTAGWTYIADTESDNYAGEEPLSEIESQLVNQVMEENKDAIFAIEYHNDAPVTAENPRATWMGSQTPAVETYIHSTLRLLSVKIKSLYLVTHDYADIAVKMGSPNGGTEAQWASKGVNGVILESASSIDGETTENNQKFATELFGNAVLSAIRQYTN